MQINTNLDFISVSRINNLPTSTTNGQPVVHEQLLAAIESLAWKDNVRVKTVGNLNLASPGASIDGVAMAVNDRLLVGSQASTLENGIYIWNGAAVAATRSLDANTGDELESAITTVDEGTSAGTTWRQTSVNFTIGVGAVAWVSFGVAAAAATEATAGIAEIATQAETDAGTDDARIVTPLKLATSPWARRGYSVLIGDGVATAIVITHNLNTRDVQVNTYRNSGSYDQVLCDVEMTTVNTATLRFAVAPTASQYKVVVDKVV